MSFKPYFVSDYSVLKKVIIFWKTIYIYCGNIKS